MPTRMGEHFHLALFYQGDVHGRIRFGRKRNRQNLFVIG